MRLRVQRYQNTEPEFAENLVNLKGGQNNNLQFSRKFTLADWTSAELVHSTVFPSLSTVVHTCTGYPQGTTLLTFGHFLCSEWKTPTPLLSVFAPLFDIFCLYLACYLCLQGFKV